MTDAKKISILLQGRASTESQRYASRRLVEQVALLSGADHLEPVSSPEELAPADFVFVHSRNPEALAAAAKRSGVGALEFRHAGAPLASIKDLAVPEVLTRAPVVALELCFLPRDSLKAFSLGPWEARTHRTSPEAIVRELIDGCAWFLELALPVFRDVDRRRRLPSAPARAGEGREARTLQSLRLAAEGVIRKAANLTRALQVSNIQWGLGLFDAVDPESLAGPPRGTRWLAPGKSAFWADPVLVEEAGRTFVLFEELEYVSWRGRLCAAELPGAREELAPRSILEKHFHLSFPFCFRHEGELYLLPEQAQSGRIQAYRARKFPFEWEDGPVLLEGFPGVDNVLFEHEGRWWLFTTSAREGNHDNHLMLFHAPGPFGPFEPHPGNPIRLGLEGSRMGGAILTSRGRLLRPAQNCTRTYGGSLQFYEIEALNPVEYRERKVNELLPDPRSSFPLALHSWSQAGKTVAIDGLRLLPRW